LARIVAHLVYHQPSVCIQCISYCETQRERDNSGNCYHCRGCLYNSIIYYFWWFMLSKESDLRTIIQKLEKGVALVREYKGPKVIAGGSGFVVHNEKGLVLTNQHVIQEGDRIEVSFPSKQFLAVVVSSGGLAHQDYPRNDWALLQLLNYNPGEIEHLPLPTDQEPELVDLVPDQVITLGYPATPFQGQSFRPSIGRVERVHLVQDTQQQQSHLIEVTQGIIEHGNSGGPLFDIDKNIVIGVNTFSYSNLSWLTYVQNFAISIWPVLANIDSSLTEIENEVNMSGSALESKIYSYLRDYRNEDAYRCAKKLDNNNITRKLAQGLLELQHNNHSKAAIYFRDVIEAQPKNRLANEYYANYLIDTGKSDNFDAALTFLNEKLSEIQDWSEGHYTRYRVFINKLKAQYDVLYYYISTFSNLDLDETRYQEFDKEATGMEESTYNELCVNALAAIEDIFHAIDKAQSFGSRLDISNLKKIYGVLIALFYDPSGPQLQDLRTRLLYAKQNLLEYLEQLPFQNYDYEGRAALCTIDFWLGQPDALPVLLDMRDSLFQRKIPYEPASLPVHYFSTLICVNQFFMSRRYAFLTKALQSLMDASRCPQVENDVLNVIYHIATKNLQSMVVNTLINTSVSQATREIEGKEIPEGEDEKEQS
jgi:S1-C subfamily serine protease